MRRLAVCWLAVALFVPEAWSAVTVLDYYRLGEADPGAVNNGVMAVTTDSSGRSNLTVVGSPSYSTNVSSDAFTVASALSFNSSAGAAYGYTTVLTPVVDNFGI